MIHIHVPALDACKTICVLLKWGQGGNIKGAFPLALGILYSVNIRIFFLVMVQATFTVRNISRLLNMLLI